MILKNRLYGRGFEYARVIFPMQKNLIFRKENKPFFLGVHFFKIGKVHCFSLSISSINTLSLLVPDKQDCNIHRSDIYHDLLLQVHSQDYNRWLRPDMPPYRSRIPRSPHG